ncbi:guanine nucleotide exchange factor MSS4 homolog [Trichogramma pretiosum]|uniref:guanine nucleotide exchange factor MSS4 homolog n=1 Tax=Trichogramma pretiosum TaxID=7493 RepID=UPI0006C9DCB2|nr:guanine nucleotide exchange factor MSS4 homolog [Trichogramma pretiosum]
MSSGNNECTVEAMKDSEGMNLDGVYCTHCPSKILNAGSAAFKRFEFPLPLMQYKKGEQIDKKETLEVFWQVDDVMTFENIGVSHKVDNIKYLACADCERGPVGWIDADTQQCYIALDRVKHTSAASDSGRPRQSLDDFLKSAK